jgi:hypothetical protein
MSDEAMARLGGLPVEIRDADFALIARTTVGGMSQALSDAGDPDEAGYVSVTLPNGATIGTAMALATAASAAPEAICDTLEALPAVSAYLAAVEAPLTGGCVSPVTDTARPGADAAAPTPLAFPPGTRIRLTPGSGWRREIAHGIDIAADRPRIRLTRRADEPTATISLRLGEAVPLCMVIAPGTTVDLSPALQPVAITLATGVPVVDDMMRLRDVGRITEVATILGGITIDDMLGHLDEHPAASALIGYGFLRTEDPERILCPFREAAARRPDFADVQVMAGEVSARLGRFDEAFDYFLRSTNLGLPAFSFGMNYLIDRLRCYETRSGSPAPDPLLADRALAALDRIQVYAPAMLHGAVLTSYTLVE